MGGGKGGGSIMGRFAGWCGNLVVGAVVIGAILVAVIGAGGTASLYKTSAQVAGTSTGITFAALPLFFKNVKGGQALVKPDTTTKAPAKAAAKKK